MSERALFAAGCFWGVEARFRKLPGVIDTRVGYTGGHTAHPTYEQVCAGQSGHAEAVEVLFNPAKITYTQLLNAFWQMHDPTTYHRQGPDVGSQYRSALFPTTMEQQRLAEASKQALIAQGRPIVTEIQPAGPFFPAEEYHQRYFEKNGRSCF